ncbi:MAG: hypothetical protein U9Q71_06710 [Pseudomonadota bacterium]|nr:hypothetical protein [Pseudomonadota bacterium]
MTETTTENRPPDPELIGPAKDFADFAELEYERRRNSDPNFDPDSFHDAVALVLSQLRTPENLP